MKNITLREEPNFVKVVMKKYIDGSIRFVVYRKFTKNEEFYLPSESVEIMKQNL